MITASQRERFDRLLDEQIESLPEHLHQLLEEVPLIVEDEPSRELCEQMGFDPDDEELCGLHSGTAMTDRSVEDSATLPDQMMLFRGPILRLTDGHAGELRKQIRITLLHEIGHHFGLDEDDLESLGYG